MKPAVKNTFRIAAMLVTLAASTVSHADKIYFVHNDHLGTPQVITDKNKNVVWEVDRDPWGNITNQIVNTLPNNVSLPGQYDDAETNYSDNWNRSYDKRLGRYLQTDLIGVRGGINTYGYADQNPSMYTDKLGLYPDCIRNLIDEWTDSYFETVPETVGQWDAIGFRPGGYGPGLGASPHGLSLEVEYQTEIWKILVTLIRLDKFWITQQFEKFHVWCTEKGKCGEPDLKFDYYDTKMSENRTLIDSTYDSKTDWLYKIGEIGIPIPMP